MIRFDLTGVVPGAARGDRVEVTLLGTFQIGGLSKAMGMLKVSEDILIRLDLTFAATPMLGAAR